MHAAYLVFTSSALLSAPAKLLGALRGSEIVVLVGHYWEGESIQRSLMSLAWLLASPVTKQISQCCKQVKNLAQLPHLPPPNGCIVSISGYGLKNPGGRGGNGSCP